MVEPGVADSTGEIQRGHLFAVVEWARRIRDVLQPVLDAHGDRVHFRPSSNGVTMVGLLPARPQRGRGGIKNLRALADSFEEEFHAHCVDIEHGRKTPEKALQSLLIRQAHPTRRLETLNAASRVTTSPVELLFVTDEIPVPRGGDRIVCDLLALRVDAGRCTPVAIELKSGRELTRLVEQVSAYAFLVDEHVDSFEMLFAALLGRAIQFGAPCEKWIVWPAAGEAIDPREAELGSHGIRVVGYRSIGDVYQFRVGAEPE